MKIFKIAAISLVAVAGLASCSNESNGVDTKVYDEATLSITLATPETRATGTPSTTDDVIDNVNVFITDGSDIAWSQYFPNSALTGTSNNEAVMTVSTAAQRVYVIANAGTDLTTAITTVADLTGSYLLDMNTATQNQLTNRWATGEAAIPTFTQNASGDYESSVSVTATFVAARITVTIVDNMSPTYDGTNVTGDLVLKDVLVLNAMRESKLFGTSLVPTTKTYLSGIDGNAAGWSPFPAATTVSADMVDAIQVNDFTTTYYYYVFENDAVTAATFPTIVTIQGEIGGNDVGYPVHLAPYEQFLTGSLTSGVQRGQSYDITITLSMDPTDQSGGGGGTWPPVTPIVSADVTVEVNITDWVPVTLGKEFS